VLLGLLIFLDSPNRHPARRFLAAKTSSIFKLARDA